MVMRMDVLVVSGLGIVMPSCRQNCRRLCQKLLRLPQRQDAVPLATEELPGKMTAVMAETNGLCGQVLPRPVKTGQLAKAGVFYADVGSGIIPGIRKGRMNGVTGRYRQINGVVRHALIIMCLHNDLDSWVGKERQILSHNNRETTLQIVGLNHFKGILLQGFTEDGVIHES